MVAIARWVFSVVLVGLCAVSHSASLATTMFVIDFPEVPSAVAALNTIQDNFLGVSYELYPFNTLWGDTNTTMPNAMQNYMSNLRARTSNALRIRIGGNSMDASTYVPTQRNMITLTNSSAYFNDVPCDFGPVFFEVLNAMSNKVGSMDFIIGLSMLDPEEDSNVIELAAAAEQQLGSRLNAMVLGNEPDLYANHGTRANYTISDYIPEIGEVLNDLRNSSSGNLLSTPIIAGPSVCCDWDLSDVLNAGLDQYPYKYYTLQHYPEDICNGADAQNTNISYFLSHSNVAAFVDWNVDGINMAKEAGVDVILTEYNSVSCGGSNISDTFAMSLWAVDVALRSAASNYTGVCLHTREFNVTYNLFDPPSPTTSTESGWRTGSPYYAALMVSELFSSNGSIVVDLNVDDSTTNVSSPIAAYGIYDYNHTSSASDRSKLVLINYDEQNSYVFTIPKNVTSEIGMRYLLAPSVFETKNISWAGQTVGATGNLENPQTNSSQSCASGCNVTVPGPGAVYVLFDPTNGLDHFYAGNSTIAGITGYSSSADSSYSNRVPSAAYLAFVVALISVTVL